jgi:hypothetical protein
MPATVEIRRLHGAGPTSTDITSANTRLNAEDAASTGTTNPVQIPASGTKYSYWAVTQLNCTVAPSVSISNLKWYTDSSNGLGTGVGLNVNTATGYVQATGTPGDTGTELTTGNYATLAGAPADAFTYTSGSPLSVTGSTSGTGAFGDRVVMQLTVTTTASPGVTPTETITWRYDEI